MTQQDESNIGKRLNDRNAIAAALHQAAQEARQRHIQAGIPAATWRNGRVVLVNPVDLSEIDAKRDSAA